MMRPAELMLQILKPDPLSSSSARVSLQRLMMLRMLVTLFAVSGAALFAAATELEVPLVLISALLTGILLSLAATLWRLRQPWIISSHELFAHLLLDVVFLLIVLLYTGGASNPLISYLLVLLAVGATLLTQLYLGIFAVLAIGIYTLFLIAELQDGNAVDHSLSHSVSQTVSQTVSQDVSLGVSQSAEIFQLHLVGMWVTFVVSAVLITVFVSRMAAAIRSRELALAEGRENAIRNEQLVAIGTLAAGTAHALGTPLSTMSVLLTDLDKETEESLKQKSIKADISLLKQQVNRCKESLNQLTRFYNKSDEEGSRQQTVSALLHDIQDYIVNIHPAATIQFTLVDGNSTALLPDDLSLKHALINIIENAIKAAASQVTVTLRSNAATGFVEISIQDDGPGIPAEVMENLGEPFISTRKDSMGLGIFLANATVQKLGGSIEMFNLSGGGAMSIIRLPALAHSKNRHTE
jgi:two-component system, sensor histidine kinase RegB